MAGIMHFDGKADLSSLIPIVSSLSNQPRRFGGVDDVDMIGESPAVCPGTILIVNKSHSLTD
jgi:hypothetical protein